MIFGQVLATGIEDCDEGLRVFVGARYKNLYVLLTDERDIETMRRTWDGHLGHILIPKPDPDQLFQLPPTKETT